MAHKQLWTQPYARFTTELPGGRRVHLQERNSIGGTTLTRLAALGTLSRSAGEGDRARSAWRVRVKPRLSVRKGLRLHFHGPTKEGAWISAVRPSRRPLRDLLRMRNCLNAINDLPHAEERSKSASR